MLIWGYLSRSPLSDLHDEGSSGTFVSLCDRPQ